MELMIMERRWRLHTHRPTRRTWLFTPRRTIGLELVGLNKRPGFHIQAHTGDNDRGLTLHVSCMLFGMWISIGSLFRRDAAEREISLSWHSGSLWWYLWMPTNEPRSDDPRWRRGSWSPVDTLLGHPRYSKRVTEEREVLIEMPERAYPATATASIATWKRPRWPWPLVVRRVELSMEDNPIPIPGKGENGWDMDDDAYYSMMMVADSVEQAITQARAKIVQRRIRYGGDNWTPEEAAHDQR